MPDNYFVRYLPLLMHFLLAGAWQAPSSFFPGSSASAVRRAPRCLPYECGMTPVGDTHEPFSVKFYMVAMLFILFDVEAIFLYPWAVILRELKMFGFWEMLVYIGIVLVGLFLYAGKRACWTGAKCHRNEGTFSGSGTRHYRLGATQRPPGSRPTLRLESESSGGREVRSG